MRNYEATEYQECCTFFEWTKCHPILFDCVAKHVNEGKRSKWAGFSLKKIGLYPGLCDYQIFVANKKYHGLFIEMKTKGEKYKKQRKEQIEFINMLKRQGYYATFAYGAHEAMIITTNYLNNTL